ncbi:hypothetical protein V1638_17085 [Pseudarthrobacter sp. J64]|uniref:hypothetical protein n=1 Tax=Pseudarthrobacter sp. J64 TaxID=3116485 RepID=UPI002E7FC974|nr:hypothetical protein [Pseudarthrobacter sp. J64]MEE2571087.1 hypothetical protein [Pseudarthrobacter sp. J64]
MTQHNGAMGEAEALKDFLQMGASVNSLTSSDYGLDLHLQLPLVPQKFGRLESEWALSGRTAHVQVKNMTKGGSPSVEDSSVEGWVSGSKVGSPTFVFVIKNNKEKTFYSPRDLARLLAIWKGRNAEKRAKGEKEIESVTLTVDAGRTFDVDLLPTLLHLWTK